jgi:hypothetical protein
MSSSPTRSALSAKTGGADDFIVQLALSKGLLTEQQIAHARSIAATHDDLTVPARRLFDVLVDAALIDAQRVAALLAEEFGMPLAPDLAALRVPGDVLGLVPRELEHSRSRSNRPGRVRLQAGLHAAFEHLGSPFYVKIDSLSCV